MSPWDTGRGGLAADAAIMSIAPVGIINAGDPAQAYQGVLVASIHQDGLERDAAAAVAAGVATALVPGATPEGVVAAMADHGSFQVRRLIAVAADLAGRSAGVDEFVERFHSTMLDHSFPTIIGQTWDPAPARRRRPALRPLRRHRRHLGRPDNRDPGVRALPRRGRKDRRGLGCLGHGGHLGAESTHLTASGLAIAANRRMAGSVVLMLPMSDEPGNTREPARTRDALGRQVGGESLGERM